MVASVGREDRGETTGGWLPGSSELLQELGHRLEDEGGHLWQREGEAVKYTHVEGNTVTDGGCGELSRGQGTGLKGEKK